jgi:formyltetrahydrofolate deformylase
MSDTSYLLTLSCPNRPGIVARVSTELFSHGGNILEAHQFDDTETGRFFTRIVFNLHDDREFPKLVAGFRPIGDHYRMNWEIRPRNERRKVLLLVSKLDHCLVDLLYRWRIGELRMDVVAIVSNHPRETYNGTDFGSIPFHHLPITRETKPQQEAQIKAIVTETCADLVVLARYMAHYVTADLDEGPIIEQDVERISHQDSPEDLVRKGRDIERRVLARAVFFHLDGRSLANEHKTVVCRD